MITYIEDSEDLLFSDKLPSDIAYCACCGQITDKSIMHDIRHVYNEDSEVLFCNDCYEKTLKQYGFKYCNVRKTWIKLK